MPRGPFFWTALTALAVELIVQRQTIVDTNVISETAAQHRQRT